MAYFTTKKGDTGFTQLNKDVRVSKNSPEIILLGKLDSLKAQNAKLAYLLDATLTTYDRIESIFFANRFWERVKIVNFLHQIDHKLYMYMGTFYTRDNIDCVDIIDKFLVDITYAVPKITGFVTPDNLLSIEADILRTKARETETAIILDNCEEGSETFSNAIGIFLNRLSDAYFAIELILIDEMNILRY
jgi:cob(I)alamin adenosyltransferase